MRRDGHVAYPHTPGYLYDCPGCEDECNCGPGVSLGTETQCIWCDLMDQAIDSEMIDCEEC